MLNSRCISGHASGEHAKHEAQHAAGELKHHVEHKGKYRCSVRVVIDVLYCAPDGQVKEAAERKVDEMKPKANEAIHQAKETGRCLAKVTPLRS